MPSPTKDTPSPIAIEAMKNAARAMIDYIEPCPWNPFPRDSPWGREIERQYRKDQIARRLNPDSDDWKDNGW